MSYKVIFQPSGSRGEIEPDTSLLDAARTMGVDLEALCGGAGVCGKCKVIIMEGYFTRYNVRSSQEHLTVLTSEEQELLQEEEIAKGCRLACLSSVQGDLVVYVPPESQRSRQVILEEGREREYKLLPAVEAFSMQLQPPSLEDNRADAQRLQEALEENSGLRPAIDYLVLKDLPGEIRQENYQVQADMWKEKEIIRVTPAARGRSKRWGLAVDVGTTTVAAYLCDLDAGEVKAKASDVNPQVAYGEDIISRITFSGQKPEHRKTMQQMIIDTVTGLAHKMTEEAGGTPEDILDAAVVFNSVMHHLFLGFDPRHLGGSPFVPASKDSLDIKARDLGLGINPSAYVHTLPLISGYVGADNVALLIAEEPHKKEELGLYIDIGTNGEVDLGNKAKLSCTSCATGPALEGAQIKFGMRAAPGAIEKVIISPEDLEPRYKIIGQESWYPDIIETPARGLCGSGIIDLVAEMYKAGIIDQGGRLQKELEHSRIRQGASGRMEYVVAWSGETGQSRDVIIDQQDIRAVQLAKAALFVGAEILMEQRGIQVPEFITLAGAFGNYINQESALAIGMFPSCEPEKIYSVGNSAGDGARLALLNREKREEACHLAREVSFVETALDSTFQERYIEALGFPQKI